jgi:hypothetical protein
LGAAETALANARAEFEMALNSPVSARPDEFVPESHHSGAPAATALANSEADDTQLVRQRLAELEQRRRLLADRLMPEHPDMKALDEKIDELGAAIAHRPQPAAPRPQGVATVPTYNQTDEDLDEKRIARSHQLWQAVVEVQNRYAAALAHEHECRRGLAATRGQLLAEIESPSEAVPTVERAAWRRWLLSTFASLLCGGLVLALWPRHRRTFTSAEEVRAVTRLPVVVVESASLN